MEHQDDFDYIRKAYNLPFLKAGTPCQFNGRRGRVTSASGAYVNIRFDDAPAMMDLPHHPTWAMTYFNELGDIVASFPSRV